MAMDYGTKLKYCVGCRENFYNGNNEYGIMECWCLKDAKVVWKKFIGMNDVPPWNWQKPVRTLECHRKKGFIKVDRSIVC